MNEKKVSKLSIKIAAAMEKVGTADVALVDLLVAEAKPKKIAKAAEKLAKHAQTLADLAAELVGEASEPEEAA